MKYILVVLLSLLFLNTCKEKIDSEDGPSGPPPTGSPFGKGAIMAYSLFDFSDHCQTITVNLDTLTGIISGKTIGSPDCGDANTAYFSDLEGGQNHYITMNCGSLFWFYDSIYAGDPCTYFPLTYASAFPGLAVLTVYFTDYSLGSSVSITVYVNGAPLGVIEGTLSTAECGEPGTFTTVLPIGTYGISLFDNIQGQGYLEKFYDLEEGCNRISYYL